MEIETEISNKSDLTKYIWWRIVITIIKRHFVQLYYISKVLKKLKVKAGDPWITNFMNLKMFCFWVKFKRLTRIMLPTVIEIFFFFWIEIKIINSWWLLLTNTRLQKYCRKWCWEGERPHLIEHWCNDSWPTQSQSMIEKTNHIDNFYSNTKRENFNETSSS